MTFDFHGTGWSPSVITALDDVLCEFPDVFSTSKTDFGSCSFLPFKISIPSDNAPVTSRPYRTNPIISKQVDTVLEKHTWLPVLDLTVLQPHGRHTEERR